MNEIFLELNLYLPYSRWLNSWRERGIASGKLANETTWPKFCCFAMGRKKNSRVLTFISRAFYPPWWPSRTQCVICLIFLLLVCFDHHGFQPLCLVFLAACIQTETHPTGDSPTFRGSWSCDYFRIATGSGIVVRYPISYVHILSIRDAVTFKREMLRLQCVGRSGETRVEGDLFLVRFSSW